MKIRGFASDNNAGFQPYILKAIEEANTGHTIGYGDDDYTREAEKQFKNLFGADVDVYFVFTGTAANVLSLSTLLKPYNAVICAETAHINVDECGAPERFIGCKLIDIPTPDGKLSPELIKPHMQGFGFEHHVQPKVISITQSTEMGTVYSPKEIKSISELAHAHNMFLHVDGARIANAAVFLQIPIKEFTLNAGVDVMTFGGTKNGLLFGEAIIFFNKKLSENFKYERKQGMQLYSKMRFVSAQFNACLSNDNWLRSAEHANKMAYLLESHLKGIPQITITQKVEANAVFAILPKHIIEHLRNEYFFYTWNEQLNEVRFMCSWDTTEEDIESFVKWIKELL
jgi:threonine aldolase